MLVRIKLGLCVIYAVMILLITLRDLRADDIVHLSYREIWLNVSS